MQAKIYCKPVAKDIHEFYLIADGEKYYLFEQKFYMSNHYYFKNGVAVKDVGDFSKAKTVTIRNTLEKLPKYLKKVSRRYGVEIKNKSQSKPRMKQNQKYVLDDYDIAA